MYTYLIIETLVGHVFVDLSTGVPLSKSQTLEVNFQRFLYHLLQWLIYGTGRLILRIVRWKYPRYFIGENFNTVRGFARVFFDAIQPPPDGVATIEPENYLRYTQVRYILRQLHVIQNKINI